MEKYMMFNDNTINYQSIAFILIYS